MEELIHLYEELHQYPELAYKEYKTQQRLLEFLKGYKNDSVVIRTYKTNIIVLVRGLVGDHMIAYRSDIDALNQIEHNEVDYRSKRNGLMHACGHDLHMTIACGLYKKLVIEPIDHNVLLLFQSAEEEGSGAKELLKVILGDYDIDFIFGLHGYPNLEVGTFAGRENHFFVGTKEVNITLRGKGAHIGMYHMGDDLLQIMIQLLQQLNHIPYRLLPIDSKSLINFGIIQGGSMRNSLMDQIELKGTIRSMNQLDQLYQRIVEVCHSLEELYNIDIVVEQKATYPPLINSKRINDFIKYVEQSTKYHYRVVEPLMIGEDFSYYLQEYDGFFLLLGVGETSSLHSSTYLPHLESIQVGVECVYDFLRKWTII